MKNAGKPLLFGYLIILFICLVLFYLDKDTHSIPQLFTPQMLFVLALYFVPIALLFSGLMLLFVRLHIKPVFALSLIISLVLGLSGVMMFFAWQLGRLG